MRVEWSLVEDIGKICQGLNREEQAVVRRPSSSADENHVDGE